MTTHGSVPEDLKLPLRTQHIETEPGSVTDMSVGRPYHSAGGGGGTYSFGEGQGAHASFEGAHPKDLQGGQCDRVPYADMRLQRLGGVKGQRSAKVKLQTHWL